MSKKDTTGKAIGKRKYNKGLPGVAGRKAYDDPTLKKIPVTVYFPKSEVDSIGGIEKVRIMVRDFLNKQISE